MEKILSGSGLRVICPALTLERAEKLAEDMFNILPAFGIYNKQVLPDFVAQCAHESDQFRKKAENLNYTTAKQIAKTWPKRFTIATAAPYVRQPVLLANKTYGGRNGNTEPNDGWDMRGSGFIQATGRGMAVALCQYFGVKSPEEMMRLCREDDYWAMSSAAWIFAVNKKLIPLAVADDIEHITLRINGGLTGLIEREAMFSRAKKVIV